MISGDAVSKLETFAWIFNHISRFIAWSLFTLKALCLVKWPITTWSFIWWFLFIHLLKFETRPSSQCWISERPIPFPFWGNKTKTRLHIRLCAACCVLRVVCCCFNCRLTAFSIRIGRFTEFPEWSNTWTDLRLRSQNRLFVELHQPKRTVSIQDIEL